MNATNLCQYLEWDSEFFGYRIARVKPHHLCQETTTRIMEWCSLHAIDCLYFLANADDLRTVQVVENNDFHLVDIRVTFEQQLKSVPVLENGFVDESVRWGTSDDIPHLKTIARESHHGSRFYSDPHFPISRCDALYETWIEKSCNGYASVVIVAELSDQPVGYVTCHLVDQTTGKIGLVGVNAPAQGKGLGKRMIASSLRWFKKQGVTTVTVVTQGGNTKAQRLYQKCGFLTQSVQLWYHRWFKYTVTSDQ
jgi:dTDP-4-amino-4,6-dideoxy-D-galactose acyltransferase